MKDGDGLLEQLKADRKYRYCCRFILQRHISYTPDWWYWNEYTNLRRN